MSQAILPTVQTQTQRGNSHDKPESQGPFETKGKLIKLGPEPTDPS